MSSIHNKALQAMIEKRAKQRFDTKAQALAVFTARKNKKKIPTFKARQEKESEYKKMSMEDYLKKYPI